MEQDSSPYPPYIRSHPLAKASILCTWRRMAGLKENSKQQTRLQTEAKISPGDCDKHTEADKFRASLLWTSS